MTCMSTAMSKAVSKAIKATGLSVVVSFTQETSTSFDGTLGVDTVSTATFTGNGVKEKYTKDEIDDTNVLSSDIKLILEKTSTAPKIGDACAIGSTSYRVMNVTPIDPGNVVINYELQLRK